MSKLPALKPREIVRVLERAGFSFIRQKGSHQLYIKGELVVTVAIHSKDMRKGMLRKIITQSGLSPEEFLALRSSKKNKKRKNFPKSRNLKKRPF